MPKISNKKRLLREICHLAQFEIVLSESYSEACSVFENAVEDLIAVETFRNSIPRLIVPKSLEWYSTVLPNLDDFRFKQFLRVTRSNFGLILSLIESNPVFTVNTKTQIPIQKQLAITLFKMGFDGTGSSICNTASLFGIGDGGTIQKVTDRVIKAILALEGDWICWPDESERRNMTAFMADKLPGNIGFIDGSHIDLNEAPVDDSESYFSRKQRYAIQIQAVCDVDRKIRNIAVGYPGSVHDARVYANSDIGRNPAKYFSDGQWLAGDSAYRVTPYMITPFRNNSNFGNSKQRQAFNKYFAGYRVKIECTFGILKETFSCLKSLRIRVDRQRGHEVACQWIRACCILYNIIMPSLADFDLKKLNIEQDEENLEIQNADNGDDKRAALFHFVLDNKT